MKPFLSVAVLMSCFFFTACNNGDAPANQPAKPLTALEKIAVDMDSFKARCFEGDLIVHLNDDIVSDVIRHMNEKDESFSHSGIVVIRNGEKFVCNIYPSIHPNTAIDTIRYEPLDSFINPKLNLAAGLFRYDLSPREIGSFVAELDRFKSKKPTFDERYQYDSDDKLYCSEMIAKALEKITHGRYQFKKIHLSEQMVKLFRIYYKRYNYTEEFVRNTEYVSVDNLYSIPQCKEIMRIKLKYMP